MITTGTDRMRTTGLSDTFTLGKVVSMLSSDAAKLIELMSTASRIRDSTFGKRITYSRKIFIPLTNICSNNCKYCNFSRKPWERGAFILRIDVAVELVKKWENKFKIKEVLVCTGERPDVYPEVREKLRAWGFRNYIEYVCEFLYRVLKETRFALPHVNIGYLTKDELRLIKDYVASVGLMIENVSPRLCDAGLPHEESPTKHPSYRIRFLKYCEELKMPVTTGILVGIGESIEELAMTLLSLRTLSYKLQCIQEIIIQNYMPGQRSFKLCTCCEPPSLIDMARTISTARILTNPEVSIQAPPNLALGSFGLYILAGINDWGGISPITPDYVNITYPWPSLKIVKKVTESLGYELRERLPVYPKFIKESRLWLSDVVREKVFQIVDDEGLVDKRYEAKI